MIDSNFGFVTITKLEQLHLDLNRKCTSDFSEFYQRALKYISERYRFSEQSFHVRISKLKFESVATFAEFSNAVGYCNLENMNMDNLYKELGPRPRLGWVEMAVGLPEGPSYPGHSDRTNRFFAGLPPKRPQKESTQLI